MIYPCGLINCSKCATVVRNIDKGEIVHVLGQGIYETFLYLCFNFAGNLKLLLKKSKKNLNQHKCLIHPSDTLLSVSFEDK